MDEDSVNHLKTETAGIFASVLVNPKYAKYQDYRTKLILRKNIADLSPYPITLPDPPKPTEFVNYGLPIEKQFFQREVMPDWLPKLNQMSRQKSLTRDYRNEVGQIAHRNPEIRNFIADQWRKRSEGIHIYIYGHPFWIPGNMWFFLNYYHMDIGLPHFRVLDIEYWYWWNICVMEDPTVYGGIQMERRRVGKSYMGASNKLERATRKPGSFTCGIVGKDEKEAKEAFLRTIILPLHKFPFFFMPKVDSRKGMYPVDRIDFRDSKNEDENVLNSWIQVGSTTTREFDGRKLNDLWANECGKWERVLVNEFWEAHKSCLRVSDDIVGKALFETTVEETTKGGLVEFRKLLDSSSTEPDRMTEAGETESGLIPYIRTAPETYIQDQYGFSIIDDPLPHQIEFRKKEFQRKNQFKRIEDGMHLKGGRELVDIEIESKRDPITKQETIRKYFRNIREALQTNAANCHFDIDIINRRRSHYIYGNDDIVAVKFRWEDNIRDSYGVATEVEIQRGGNIRDHVLGKALFKKDVWEYLKSISNNVSIMDGWRVPGNKHKGIIAVDPYKYDADATETERKSLGVAHCYLVRQMDIDPDQDKYYWKSDDLVMEFAFRGSVNEFNEYLCMIATFLGMKIDAETNSGNVVPYLTQRRYDMFLYHETKFKTENTIVTQEKAKNAGFITLGENTQQPLFDAVRDYIDLRGHQCVFPLFLDDCAEVEFKGLTKYDRFVSGGNAIRIGQQMSFKRVEKTAYYVCEFHPTVRLMKQGECPKCGERLEKEVHKGFTGIDSPTLVAIR